MRKIVIFALLIFVIGVVSFSSNPILGPTEALGQNVRKVLMIPREGYSRDLDLMLKMEVGVMISLLKNAGFEVDIATTSGQPILGCTEKIEMNKVMQLSAAKLENYAGVIMPCMAVGAFPGPPVSPETVAIVKEALAGGKPVAASTFSVTILAEAGVLKGKKYAYPRDPLKTEKSWGKFGSTDQRFIGAIYSGPGVIQDGNIITSGGCPWMERVGGGLQSKVVELTQTFIKAIGPK
jgi:putative intracellular protease/amidase